jgi:predicted neuraminidase
MLFFKIGPNPQEWWGELMLSYDRGRSFQSAQRLPEGIDGPVRSKPIRLENGALLFPSSTEHSDDWRFHFEKLNDGEWSRVEPQQQLFQVIQPTLLNHPGQRIQALYRSKHGAIITNESKDGGESWSTLKKLGLPNNNSGIEGLTLSDGRHLLLYNHLGGQGNNGWGKRHAIHLAISDDGIVWKALAVIEKATEGEFSYPAMIQTKDGLVHMTYTWNRKRVKHVVIDPENLKPGIVLNEEAWPE